MSNEKKNTKWDTFWEVITIIAVIYIPVSLAYIIFTWNAHDYHIEQRDHAWAANERLEQEMAEWDRDQRKVPEWVLEEARRLRSGAFNIQQGSDGFLIIGKDDFDNFRDHLRGKRTIRGWVEYYDHGIDYDYELPPIPELEYREAEGKWFIIEKEIEDEKRKIFINN